MPYLRANDLPKQLNNLPSEAKVIYSRAFNNAEKYYAKKFTKNSNKLPLEIIAAKVAWNAVKRRFVKARDGWIKKAN